MCLGSISAASCTVGHRRGSDPVWLWLWLWHRPAVAALIHPLVWELPYATGAAIKIKKREKRERLAQEQDVNSLCGLWIIQCLGLEQERGCVLRLLWMFTFQPGWGLSRPMGGAFRCPSVPHLGCCLFRDAPSCAGTGVGSARSRMHAFPLLPPRPLSVLVLPGTGAGTASDGGSPYSCVAAWSLHSAWYPLHSALLAICLAAV